MLELSIIIPCHNNSRVLPWILESINGSLNQNYEIICVDDSSSEDIHSIAKNFGARCIRLPDGLPGRRSLARMEGHNASQGTFTLYLDGDIIPESRLIASIPRLHELYPKSILKFPVYNIPQHTHLDDLPSITSFISEYQFKELGPLLKKRSSIDTLDLPRRLQNTRTNMWMLCASNCFSVEKIHVEDAGGWDDNFIGWGEEDLELAYRLHVHGLGFVYLHRRYGAAYHIDHPIDWSRNLASLFKNVDYFRKKHPESWVSRSPVLFEFLRVNGSEYYRELAKDSYNG